MSIVLLITTAGLVPNVKATRPLTRGEPQIWDEFDLAKTNGQLLRDWGNVFLQIRCLLFVVLHGVSLIGRSHFQIPKTFETNFEV